MENSKVRRFLAALACLWVSVAYADQNSIVIPETGAAWDAAHPTIPATPHTFENTAKFFINPALKSITSNSSGSGCGGITSPESWQWCVDTLGRTVNLNTAPTGGSPFSFKPAFNINADGSLVANTPANNPATLFDQVFCNTVGYVIARLSSSWACAKQIPVNLNWLGADPTGVNDASGLINATAATLGTTGGTMELEPGTYKIGSTLTIGNGTSSSGSTLSNVRLRGKADPKMPPGLAAGFPTQTGGVTLLWSGSAAPVVSVRGPLQKWGLSNLYIDCNGVATIGVEIISAQLGNSQNVSIAGCQSAGIRSTAVAPFGLYTNTDSYRNSWYDFIISVPNLAGAKGVELTAPSVAGGNTDYNTFVNLSTWQLGGSANWGVYLAGCDSNMFYGYKPVKAGSQPQIAFDYTITDAWPAANVFFGTEAGMVNIGTPTQTSRPNVVYGILEANGNTYPTTIPNVMSALPSVMGNAVNLLGQTTSLSLRGLSNPTLYHEGLYRVNYYLSVTTNGTAGNIQLQFQWSDSPSGPGLNLFSSLASATAQGYTTGSFLAYLLPSRDMLYQVNFPGVTGSPVYQLHLAMERLD